MTKTRGWMAPVIDDTVGRYVLTALWMATIELDVAGTDVS